MLNSIENNESNLWFFTKPKRARMINEIKNYRVGPSSFLSKKYASLKNTLKLLIDSSENEEEDKKVD